MKRVKIVLSLVIMGFIAVVCWQNSGFIMGHRPFKIITYQSPDIYNGVLLLGAFLVGLLIAYIYSLGERFKSRKRIKDLTARLDACNSRVAELERRSSANSREVQATDNRQG